MTEDLCYLSATEALRRFRSRDLSPVELMEAVIARAEVVEPTINAFAFTRYEEAIREARAAETRYARRGEPPRPLEGIPLAIKDETAVAGQPMTNASLLFADDVAEETSPYAARMLDAGAIQHARSTAPEFSCAGFTHSRLHGVTRNPWNPEFGCGGSSGGSGASLAAGSTTLAAGSDIGGSIRIPASFCGVVGFKAPYGRVPVEPPFNLDSYCHNGGLARTVADMALFQNVLAGPHPMDVFSLRPRYELPSDLAGVEGLRVALSPGLGSYPLDPEVERNAQAAADALRAAGAIVEEVDLVVDSDDVRRAAAMHFTANFGAWVGSVTAERRELATGYAIAFVEQFARDSEGMTVPDGLDCEVRVWTPIAAVLERYDALLCATCGTRGLIAGDDYADHGLEVGGVDVPFYFQSLLTPVFNIASACPVLAVPSGVATNGVPTGVQIVGRTYDDVTPFRLGAALERERPWLHERSARPRLPVTAG